jgi:alpha-tubulin suppressor-like RCC1 family protein
MNKFTIVVRHLSAFIIFGILLSTFNTFSQTGLENLTKSSSAGLSGKGLLVDESFDDETFPPPGWQNIQLTGSGLWARTTAGIFPGCSPHSGAGMAFYDNYNFGANVSAMLVTPSLLFPAGLPKNVNFWMYRDNGWPTYADSLEVYYNATPEMNGAVLLGKVARYYWMSDWFEFNYEIPASVSGSYYVIFKAISNWGNDIFLDDIEIRALHANDAGVVSIVSPPAMVIEGDVTPEIIVRNFGTQAQTNIPVKYRNGQTGQVFTEIVPLLDADTSVNVVFPAWTATAGGPYEFLFYTDLPGDEDRTNDTLSKTIVSTGSNQSYVHSFSGGLYHSLSVCNDKTVMAWGRNADGQLGDGTNTDSNTPAQLASLSNVIKISAGKYHSVALKDDGSVWCFGNNSSGQLGNGGTVNSNVPVQVSGLSDVIGISGGASHTLALKSDSTVWAWGSNLWGELGNGTTTGSEIPVQVTGLSGAIAVSAGDQYSMALLGNGTVVAWGINSNGQLGNGTLYWSNIPVPVSGLSGVTCIAAGTTHSIASTNNGTVWAWGNNSLGQLGNNTNVNSRTPVQTASLSGITSISLSDASSYAVKYDGTAWAWGWNSNGQLGNGTTVDSNVPIQITGLSDMIAVDAGAFHALSIDAGSSLFSWGYNSYGQLGNGSNNDSYVPVLITGLCPVYTSTQNLSETYNGLFFLYPNPSEGNFNLQLELGDKLQQNNGFVEIYNPYGQKVMATEIVVGEPTQISLLGKGKGMFLVRIYTCGSVYSEKIIIK